MLFSSTLFLFLFLPLVLGANFVVPRSWRNALLFGSSLVFYAWGEVFYVALMLVSIGANYGFGLLVDRLRGTVGAKFALAAALVVNLGLLVAFKYANFLADNLDFLIALFRGPAPEGRWIELAPVHLPIGISFFTFQAISYVVDVYRSDARVQRNLLDLGLFISLFPQLIAGPIVRYETLEKQLRERRITLEGFTWGVRRFVNGLGKKVLIANAVSVPVERIFSMPADELTPAIAWLGVICYSFQIYFDFSGYSDMAIGLGRMFGFQLPENFNFPYIARSIREFWRRWHISLSTWFRDYLYIPLGGSRHGALRTSFNLLVVFFLCGLWHGASWTYVVWGLYHGFFLSLERVPLLRPLARVPNLVKVVYTVLIWMQGWVLFRAETLEGAWRVMRAQFFLSDVPSPAWIWDLWTPELQLALPIALVCAFPLHVPIARRLAAWRDRGRVRNVALSAGGELLGLAYVGLVLFACAVSLSATTHNPFIYFQF